MKRCAIDDRYGFVSVLVLIAMVAATMIAMASLTHVAQQTRRESGKASGPQIDLLSEAAIELAKVRLASDANYTGETWEAALSNRMQSGSATVVVKVSPGEEANRREIQVDIEAGESVGQTIRQQRTKTITLPESEEE